MNRYAQRDAVLKQIGFESYSDYRKSPLYARIRARVFKQWDTCVCGKPATQIHHMSYKRRYLEGRGKIHKFLVPLCDECHKTIEFDYQGKCPLGWANRRLDNLRLEYLNKGIPQAKSRRKRRVNAFRRKGLSEGSFERCRTEAKSVRA